MKKFKLPILFVLLLSVNLISSCTDLEEETDYIENSEKQTAEKTMRRGGIND